MKRKLVVILFSFVLLLVGCQKEGNDQRLKVFTSFYQLYDLTYKIGEDKINLVNLVPYGEEIHDFEISSTKMAQLGKSDLFIYNGLGLEPFIDKVKSSLKNQKLTYLEASEDIEIIENDPHVWLSVANAKKELENIKNKLVELDNVNADFYEANYARYAIEFDQLHQDFLDANFNDSTVVVTHSAFGYMSKEYNFRQKGLLGIDPEQEPDPKKLAELIKFVEDNKIKTVYYSEVEHFNLAKQIANNKAKVLRLHPLEGLTKEEMNNKQDYLSIMKQNLQALKEGLVS